MAEDTMTCVAPDAPRPSAREREASAQRLRVLVVEDEPDTAKSYDMLLSLWGHDVRTWRTGQDVLARARECRPDVVLLDIGLPRMDGFQVARLLRGDRELGNMTLVGATGFADPAHRERSAEAGLDYYLIKPVDPQALQALLAALARRKAGRPAHPAAN